MNRNMYVIYCAMFYLFVQTAVAQTSDANINKAKPFAVKGVAEVMVEYRVVGYTKATEGDIRKGYAGMNKKCANEVHPSARAAFSVEFIRTAILEDIPTKGAWVLPTNPRPFYRPDLSKGDDHFWSVTEEAGGISTSSTPELAMENALNCSFFTSDKFNRSGLIGTSKGVRTAACNSDRPIACAAPVATELFSPTFDINIKTKASNQGKVLAPNN